MKDEILHQTGIILQYPVPKTIRIHQVGKPHGTGKTMGQITLLSNSVQELSPPPYLPQHPKHRTFGYFKNKADSMEGYL